MNAETKTCCLIGNPVGHSLSPLIHNTLAEKLNINMVYTAYRVEKEKLHDAVAGAAALGFHGMNVTVPHKCDIMKELDETDETAERIGAVNTVKRTERGYRGYNTDYTGLGRQLDEEGITIKNRSVIIIGAGGAAKAAAYMCGEKGASAIYILNRSRERAERLAGEINSYFGERASAMGLDEYKNIPVGKYPVIQTTSAGLYPNVSDTAICDDGFYEYVECGVDIIFNPEETMFMKKCRKAGAPAHNGLKMLLYQGVAAFELWNDLTVPDEIVRQVYGLLSEELKKR